MERVNRPKNQSNNVKNKKRMLSKDEIIKKRIEILLTIAIIGTIIGIVIGILLPIGSVKKSEYKKMQEVNKKLEEQLKNANNEIEKLNKEIDKSSIFTNLDESQKEHVINYIASLDANNTSESDMKVDTTEIYDIFYKEYSYSLGYLSYKDFNAILETFEYEANIVEEENKHKVKFVDESTKDNITLTFSDINNDTNEVLTDIKYVRGDKFIEVNYEENTSSIKYITSQGDNPDIKNINDQARYLFTE